MYIQLTQWSDYFDVRHQEFRDSMNVSLWGLCQSNPIPTFGSLTLNQTVFDATYGHPIPGALALGQTATGQDALLFTGLDTVQVMVQTSVGRLTGTITRPGTPQHLRTVPSDTLRLGQPLTIRWTGTPGAAYNVVVNILEQDMQGQPAYQVHNVFLADSMLTLPAGEFTTVGQIVNITVGAYNGPLAKAGAKPNMTGTGSGYLIYSADLVYLDQVIPIISSQGTTKPFVLPKMIPHPKTPSLLQHFMQQVQ